MTLRKATKIFNNFEKWDPFLKYDLINFNSKDYGDFHDKVIEQSIVSSWYLILKSTLT